MNSADNGSNLYKTIVAFRLKYIPDFLADHSLGVADPPVRLSRHFLAWTRFINRFRAWSEDSAVFALRYFKHPKAAEVQTYVLARAVDSRELPALREFLRNTLEMESLPIEELSIYQYYAEFLAILQGNEFSCAELTQKLESANVEPAVDREPKLRFSARTASRSRVGDVSLPWRGPGGTFLQPIHALSRCRSAAAITIILSPTALTHEEKAYLRAMATATKSASEISPNDSENSNPLTVGTIRNPNAEEFAARFSWNVMRLQNPFLISVHCMALADRDDSQLRMIVGALHAVICDSPDVGAFGEGVGKFNTGIKVSRVNEDLHPGSMGNAIRNFNLDLNLWAAHAEIPPAAARLPYLVDAVGAATVFRLPINLNGGAPSLMFRQPIPQTFGIPNAGNGPVDSFITLGEFEGGGKVSIAIDQFNKHCLITGFTGSGKTTTIKQILRQMWGRGFREEAADTPTTREADYANKQRIYDDALAAWQTKRIPFLVIESAKAEYRTLFTDHLFTGYEQVKTSPGIWRPRIRIFTLGNDAICPFRLNPFEILPGIRVESHASRLLECFKAMMTDSKFASSILAEALERLYINAGWNYSDLARNYSPTEVPPFPTLTGFYHELARVVATRGYSGEVASDVTASIIGRIKRLMMGSLGAMFNCKRSFPIAEVLDHPTILELNALGEEDKQFACMLILVFLREYRETQKPKYDVWKQSRENVKNKIDEKAAEVAELRNGIDKQHNDKAAIGSELSQRETELRSLEANEDGVCKLWHVTVVEEAHNVFSNQENKGSSNGGADAKEQTVQAFCNMISEIRSFGEGLIVADQSPSKLAPDAIRNTNIQICHALRDSRDREAMARAMIMTSEQQEFLGKQREGAAALFATGFERATFFNVDPGSLQHRTPDDASLEMAFREDENIDWWYEGTRCGACAESKRWSCGFASRLINIDSAVKKKYVDWWNSLSERLITDLDVRNRLVAKKVYEMMNLIILNCDIRDLSPRQALDFVVCFLKEFAGYVLIQAVSEIKNLVDSDPE